MCLATDASSSKEVNSDMRNECKVCLTDHTLAIVWAFPPVRANGVAPMIVVLECSSCHARAMWTSPNGELRWYDYHGSVSGVGWPILDETQ